MAVRESFWLMTLLFLAAVIPALIAREGTRAKAGVLRAASVTDLGKL